MISLRPLLAIHAQWVPGNSNKNSNNEENYQTPC